MQDVLDLMKRAAGVEVRPACPGSAFGTSLPAGAPSTISLWLNPYFSKAEFDTVFVVSIEANTGQTALGSYRAFVSYDQRYVTPVSCTTTCNLSWSADTVALADVNPSGWTGEVTLASIAFRAVASWVTVPLSLNADEIIDATGHAINACQSADAEVSLFMTESFSPTPTPTPGLSTPSPSPSLPATPAPPSPAPCDAWSPALLGCNPPVRAGLALWVLNYVVRQSGPLQLPCPPFGGK